MTTPSGVNPGGAADQAAFEKARMEYCAKLYEREAERKELLEKKAQFLLSVITLFLGAVFLKLDFLSALQKLIAEKSTGAYLAWILSVPVAFLALALLTALVAVLQSLRLQSYKNEYPANVVSSLFAPDSRYLVEKRVGPFYSATAMSYVIALEFNKKNNDKKARWVKVAWLGVLGAALSLAVFLFAFAGISML